MFNWYSKLKLIHQIGLVVLVGFILSFVLSLYLLSYDKSQRLNQLSVSGSLQRVLSVADTLEQTPDNVHASIITASRSSDLQLSLTDTPTITQNSSPNEMEQTILRRLEQIGVKNAHIELVTQNQRPLMALSQPQQNHRADNLRGESMMDNRAMMGNGMMANSSASHRHNMAYYRQANAMLSYTATVNGSIELSSGQWLNFSSGIESNITHWSTSVLIGLATVMVLTILLVLWVVRRALAPVTELGNAAQAFARNKQVYPVNATNTPRDLTPTIDAFNDMQHQVTDYITERTKLLAAISHDLRTPLTSLRLRLEFIEDSDDKQQMLSTLNTMEKMLTATMQFARNDVQREPRQMTDINSLLQTIVDEYDEKGVEIHYQATSSLTASIPTLSVQRMIENLINNAIQYAGDEAEIDLSVRRTGQQLQICVADTGVGIPEHQLAEVLKPFTRLNEARDTGSSNVGLGLSITHSLASSFGGRLMLAANTPHGLKATITLSIPRNE